MEAFEEAGVHGRIEAASFARYIRRKRGSNGQSAAAKIAVYAHLCEVLRLEPPEEANRNPTWFPADRAKKRLQEGRAPDDCTEFARVVDRAVERIQRLQSSSRAPTDALNKVEFEACEQTGFRERMKEAWLAGYVRREREAMASAAAVELVQEPDPSPRRLPQLTSGAGPVRNDRRS